MNKFKEDKLEQAIIELLIEQGFPHTRGDTLKRKTSEVLIEDDLREFLSDRYAAGNRVVTMIRWPQGSCASGPEATS